jgi:hypothetical protein
MLDSGYALLSLKDFKNTRMVKSRKEGDECLVAVKFAGGTR